jgi:BCCT family betaine/carnitine transporter
MKKHARNTDVVLIVVPLVLILAMTVCFIVFSDHATALLTQLRAVLDNYFGSWYALLGVASFLCTLYLAFSRFGSIRLGSDEKPAYSGFTWGTMIFTSTMAADIVFYSFCEWGLYAQDPFIQAKGNDVLWAATYPLFHWGPIAWSFYLVLAAAFGFMLYVRGRQRQKMSEACRPLLGSRTDGWLGRLIDLVCIFALLAGTATTFSLSVPLLSAAVSRIFGIGQTVVLSIIVLAAIAAVYSVAVLVGMKAVSRLATVCTWLFFALLAYVFLCGGRGVFILETGISAMGNLVQNFVGMATWLDPARESWFPQNWTMYYWAYWMVWCVATPFFIGQISRGRTIRELILGGYFWGLAGTWLSFLILGNYGLSLDVLDGMGLAALCDGGAGAVDMILAIFDTLPLPEVGLALLTLTMCAFYATTFDALTMVAAVFSTKKLSLDQLPAKKLRLFWAVLFILLPIGLLFSGSTMNNLQSVSLIAALPISVVLVLIAVSFFKDAAAYLKEK